MLRWKVVAKADAVLKKADAAFAKIKVELRVVGKRIYK